MITDAGGDVAATTAVSGKVYTLSETSVTGYSAGSWVCTDTATPDMFTQTGRRSPSTRGRRSAVDHEHRQQGSPTGTTVQRWVLHDTLTIEASAGSPERDDATVTFRLYSDIACNAQIGDDEVIDLVGNTATTVAGVPVAETGEYRWRAAYSGDDYNNEFTTACGSRSPRSSRRTLSQSGTRRRHATTWYIPE